MSFSIELFVGSRASREIVGVLECEGSRPVSNEKTHPATIAWAVKPNDTAENLESIVRQTRELFAMGREVACIGKYQWRLEGVPF